jgi:hypothetical protein
VRPILDGVPSHTANVRAQPDAVNTEYSPLMGRSYLGTSPFSVANKVAAAREDTPILR